MAKGKQPPKDGAPFGFGEIGADAIGREFVVAVRSDLVGALSEEEIDVIAEPVGGGAAGAWRTRITEDRALRAASVASQVTGGSRQLSQLPQGFDSSPK